MLAQLSNTHCLPSLAVTVGEIWEPGLREYLGGAALELNLLISRGKCGPHTGNAAWWRLPSFIRRYSSIFQPATSAILRYLCCVKESP